MLDRKEHMTGSMGQMMDEKMVENMSKEDMMKIEGMKMDQKISLLEVKLDYHKKLRDMMNSKI